jgi:drug/metabolite transporter (DMT)-like permease
MNVGFVFALAAAVTWGLVYAIDQKILINTPPLTLLFIQCAVSAIILLPLLFIDRVAIKEVFSSGWTNLSLIFLSIVLATLASYFIFSGIKLVGASAASIIEIAYPLFVVLFCFVLYQNTLSLSVAVGGVFIFIGAVIITYFN